MLLARESTVAELLPWCLRWWSPQLPSADEDAASREPQALASGLKNGQGITGVAKVAKSFGCPAIAKVLATFATAKCDTYSLADTYGMVKGHRVARG